MTIELDHFFILTNPGAPQAEQLSQLGLVEGTSNEHQGQGTANRRFFFSNSMLELAYLRDASEAVNGSSRQLQIVERVADSRASPFGVLLRASSTSSHIPFPGWRYYPEYFEANQYFHIGENSDILEEPLCIYVPFDVPLPESQPQPAEPFTTVSELRLSVPVIQPSSVLQAIEQIEGISLYLDEPHRMEIIFNEERLGQVKDLRPELPLIIRW